MRSRATIPVCGGIGLCREPDRHPRVSRYLERHHPEILGEFKTIIAATSLEDAASGMPED